MLDESRDPLTYGYVRIAIGYLDLSVSIFQLWLCFLVSALKTALQRLGTVHSSQLRATEKSGARHSLCQSSLRLKDAFSNFTIRNSPAPCNRCRMRGVDRDP